MALISFPFFGLVFCIMETGLDYYALSNLDAVTQKISRQIQIGAIQQQGLNSAKFNNAVCAMLPTMMGCSNLAFSVQTVSTSFYALTTAQTTGGLTQYSLKQPSLTQASNPYCTGGGNDYVVVQMIYTIPVITGIWATSTVTNNGSSVRVLSTTNVFRNEAFSSASVGSC